MPAETHPNFRTPGADTTLVASSAADVVKHDTNELTYVSRALYVGTGGSLKVTMADGAEVTFLNIVGGREYPFAVRKVFNTGTSASNIIALY